MEGDVRRPCAPASPRPADTQALPARGHPRSLRPTHGLDSRTKVENLEKAMRKEGYYATKPIDAVEVDEAL